MYTDTCMRITVKGQGHPTILPNPFPLFLRKPKFFFFFNCMLDKLKSGLSHYLLPLIGSKNNNVLIDNNANCSFALMSTHNIGMRIPHTNWSCSSM